MREELLEVTAGKVQLVLQTISSPRYWIDSSSLGSFVQSVSSNKGSLASFVGYEMVGKEHHPAYLCESTAKLLDLEGSDF